MPVEYLSRNPTAILDLKNDPLFLKDRVRLRTLITILNSQERAPRTFHQYSTPFMVIQGGKDKAVNPNVAF
jgi:hypothetical protein